MSKLSERGKQDVKALAIDKYKNSGTEGQPVVVEHAGRRFSCSVKNHGVVFNNHEVTSIIEV